MKLLIGVDGSEASFEAARQAVQLTSPQRDSVALYYSPPKLRFHEADQNVAEAQARVRGTLGLAVFEAANTQLPKPLRDNAQTILGEESPRSGLLSAAEKCRADWIALGARGAGPLTSALLGSVATHVARNATIPVLIARPRPASATTTPAKVLLATDGSPATQQTANFVRQLFWPGDAQGYVMTVVESILPGEIPPWLAAATRSPEIVQLSAVWEREQQQDEARTRQELASFAGTLPPLFHGREPIVAAGHPTARILETAARQQASLIVVGASGKNTMQRFFLGSTSEAVLSQATCSVLIVRELPGP